MPPVLLVSESLSRSVVVIDSHRGTAVRICVPAPLCSQRLVSDGWVPHARPVPLGPERLGARLLPPRSRDAPNRSSDQPFTSRRHAHSRAATRHVCSTNASRLDRPYPERDARQTPSMEDRAFAVARDDSERPRAAGVSTDSLLCMLHVRSRPSSDPPVVARFCSEVEICKFLP